MQFNYPQSMSCRFDGFPQQIEIRCGDRVAELSPLFSFGSKVILSQTPSSGQELGWMPDQDDSDSYYDVSIDYNSATGQYTYVKVYKGVNDVRKIYTDTGNDWTYGLKVSFLGRGTFFTKSNTDQFYSFCVYKAIRVESSSGSVVEFGDNFTCATQVPISVDLASMYTVPSPTYNYSDPIPGSFEQNGDIYIGGVKFTISNGSTIVVHSSGGDMKISYINGGFIIY
jgi:hypothetical protein